jgi:hypothetical protein
LGGLLHVPDGWQLLTPPVTVQDKPSLAQVPPVDGHWVSEVQEPLTAPAQRLRLQSALVWQLLPATLHVPEMAGHWLSAVHWTPVCTLQLP